MKKAIIAVGFVISFILIGLGVYGLILNKIENKPINKDDKNGLNFLKQSFETIKSINNFSYEINVTTNKETANSVNKFDLITKQSEITMTINGILALHSYTVLENGVLVNYISSPIMGNEGFVKTIETENSSSINFDRTRFDILLNNIKLFEDKGNNMFVATIPKELASSLIVSANEDEKDKMEVLGDIQLVVVLNNNNNIEKIIYDYSNAMKSGEEVYTNYIVTEKYYDIDNTIISVPDEVKNSVTGS